MMRTSNSSVYKTLYKIFGLFALGMLSVLICLNLFGSNMGLIGVPFSNGKWGASLFSYSLLFIIVLSSINRNAILVKVSLFIVSLFTVILIALILMAPALGFFSIPILLFFLVWYVLIFLRKASLSSSSTRTSFH